MAKKKIIEKDELESDLRRILNYGHTFGHALESVTDNKINHGMAVIWGIDIANFIFNLIQKNKFDFFVKRCDGVIHLSSEKYISLLDFMKIIGKITKKTKLIKSAKESDFKSKYVKPQYLGLKSNYQGNIRKIYNLGSKLKINEYINEISDTYYLN